MKNGKEGPGVMAFFHPDGFVSAWNQAMQFAGKDGRVATLPEIIAARLATETDAVPWQSYFTTLSAEYFGIGRNGRPTLIVAHGVGPMSTFDGIMKAYSYEYEDKERNRRGGRISKEEFLALERGEFGEVATVDLLRYTNRSRYPFYEVLCTGFANYDDLLLARLGLRAKEYIARHAEYARDWHERMAKSVPENSYGLDGWDKTVERTQQTHIKDSHPGAWGPYILRNEDASNCGYGYRDFKKGNRFVTIFETFDDETPIAHLLSIGGLMHLRHTVELTLRTNHESLVSDISCHEWHNGVRLAAIQPRTIINDIHPGLDARQTIKNHWSELMRKVAKPSPLGLRALVKIGEQWFTQYPKIGERMDTYEAEYKVTAIQAIGEPVEFQTTIGGYYGFFKYGIKEVEVLAPVGANAYELASEPEIVSVGGNPKFHKCLIQFYKVEADTTQRLVRPDKLQNDYKTLFRLTVG